MPIVPAHWAKPRMLHHHAVVGIDHQRAAIERFSPSEPEHVAHCAHDRMCPPPHEAGR